ncbi:coadhesin-like [Gigantopelta aegis]|uniref:coadhesin-like n=1 Tax=Gigantopelta aegis TaxID=1735272 RepID=UPI001B88E711|nr:coadhesin-like [Gigantopelta aegis]
MGCLSLSLVVFCLAIATVLSTCPSTYIYRRANRCTGFRNQRCGMFGWGRCRRSYTYICHISEQRTCPAPSVSYGGWGSCTSPCGGGLQYRTKYMRCSSSCGGARTTTRESRRCNTGCCPVNGGWSATTYGSWGECSTSCGGGVQTRTLNRGCNNPTPSCNGRSCSGLASWQEDRACNPNPCPVDGGWTEFTEWTDYDECSVLCGNGTKKQHRERDCTNPTPQYGGAECEGADSEHQFVTCNEEACGDRCLKDTITYLSHPNNEQRFYQCDNGRAVLHSCPTDTRWSQDSTTCVTEQQTTAATTAAPENFCTGRSTGYYANSDCHRYNRCVNGRLYEMTCASGLKWSQSASTCVRGDC